MTSHIDALTWKFFSMVLSTPPTYPVCAATSTMIQAHTIPKNVLGVAKRWSHGGVHLKRPQEPPFDGMSSDDCIECSWSVVRFPRDLVGAVPGIVTMGSGPLSSVSLFHWTVLPAIFAYNVVCLSREIWWIISTLGLSNFMKIVVVVPRV